MAKLTHINPDNVPDYLTYGLSHAVVAEGGKTIYLSGQVGWNEKSESVGADLAGQLAQAHENIRRVLAAAAAPWRTSSASTPMSPTTARGGRSGERRQQDALRRPHAALDDADGRPGPLFAGCSLRGRGDGGHRLRPPPAIEDEVALRPTLNWDGLIYITN